ncbi:MAG: hypothetical protein ACXIT9_12830 [Nitritalea sp.]
MKAKVVTLSLITLFCVGTFSALDAAEKKWSSMKMTPVYDKVSGFKMSIMGANIDASKQENLVGYAYNCKLSVGKCETDDQKFVPVK